MKSHLQREEGRKPTNLGGLRCEPLAWESSLIHNKSANPATPIQYLLLTPVFLSRFSFRLNVKGAELNRFGPKKEIAIRVDSS